MDNKDPSFGGDTPALNVVTPTRKSDQWHRLAKVVRSNQHTFAPPDSAKNHALAIIKRQRSKDLPSRSTKQELKSCKQIVLHSSELATNSPNKIRPLSAVSKYRKDDSNSIPVITPKNLSQDYRAAGDSHTQRLIPKALSKKVRPPNDSKRTVGLSSVKYFIITSAFLLVSVSFMFSSDIQSHFSNNRFSSRNLTIQDVSILKKNFKEKLFGQHLASKIICDLIERLAEETRPVGRPQMVVMSIHGWTGVGKTLTNKILLNSLDPEKFLQFIIPIDFPHTQNDGVYKASIRHILTTNISRNAVNLITFDEMDKASEGVLEGIVDSIEVMKFGKEFSLATLIIVFVSNTHGRDINKRLFHLLDQGYNRETLTMSDFYTVFQNNPDNQVYHWYNLFTHRNLIDSFVPYLPLNIQHVKKCIEANLVGKGLTPNSKIVDKVSEELSFFHPEISKLAYSHTGCKRVSEKVDLQAEPIF